MPLFIQRTYIEPTATLPMEITLPRGAMLGITDGGGSLPSLRVWQEVEKPHAAAQPAEHDRWQVWVLRHGQRAPAGPVGRPWSYSAVIEHNHQPAVVYALNLGPAPKVKSTAEILADEETADLEFRRQQRLAPHAPARMVQSLADPFHDAAGATRPGDV